MNNSKDLNEAEHRSNIIKLAIAKLINHLILVAFGSLALVFIIFGVYASSPANLPSSITKTTLADKVVLLFVISIIPSLIYFALMWPVFKNIVILMRVIMNSDDNTS